VSALLGHADAARCMEKAFRDAAAFELDGGGVSGFERSMLLSAIANAYQAGANNMEAEVRRQIGATPVPVPNEVERPS